MLSGRLDPSEIGMGQMGLENQAGALAGYIEAFGLLSRGLQGTPARERDPAWCVFWNISLLPCRVEAGR